MSIEKVLVSVVAGLFQMIAVCFIVFSQIPKQTKKRKLSFAIFMWLYCTTVFLFVSSHVRFITGIAAMSIFMYFLLQIRDKKVILYGFNAVILLTISEVLCTILLVFIGINSQKLVNDFKYNLLVNIMVSIVTIIILKLPLTKKLLKKEKNVFDKKPSLVNYLYMFLLILYLIVSKNGLEFILKSNYYVNILFVVGVIIIFGIIIKNESKYERLKEENKQMYNHVTKYEKIITEQGKVNHEFKNQLMVIRGYAQMKSDKLLDYIDSITQDANKTHSSYLISQLNKFPEGGIKGLLYYKLSIMEDENIKYELDVQAGVKTKLNSLSINMYKNITKILGVLLDNAIDASKRSKEKQIIISVLKDKSKVIFSISNSYKGKLNLDKIGTGFTTKGLGHGYGLRLVNDIMKETNSFEVTSEVKDKYYVSNLIIKIGKKKKVLK